MKTQIIVCSILTTMLPGVAAAGDFDCSVIYDEFDSLMNKEFLISPGNYVPTVKDRLSRDDYNSKQKGAFLLKAERENFGVAVFRTNKNKLGKLLFTWGAPFENGNPTLVLKEVVLFDDVMKGKVQRTLKDVKVGPSFTIDLDTGKLAAGDASDLWFHNIDGREMYIDAIKGASLEFPMESLCKKSR